MADVALGHIEKAYIVFYGELVDCSGIVKAGKYIPDTYYVNKVVLAALYKAKSILRAQYPEKIDNFWKFPVNSCFRYPFTVIRGSIDYTDLTDRNGHWTGKVIDFDFVGFAAQTGLNGSVLLNVLKQAGFKQNLTEKGIPNEEHHLAIVE